VSYNNHTAVLVLLVDQVLEFLFSLDIDVSSSLIEQDKLSLLDKRPYKADYLFLALAQVASLVFDDHVKPVFYILLVFKAHVLEEARDSLVVLLCNKVGIK
jgi:hypothetical protein